FGFELQLWLGGTVSTLDIAGDGNLVRADQHGAFGGAFGFGAGFRVGPVLIGPRVGLTLDPAFALANLALGAEVALLPGDIAPYVRASVGATLVTALERPLPDQEEAGILGVGVEVGAG